MIRQFVLRHVLAVMESRPPDFVVGAASDPYLLRWYAIPRNRWCGVYLHKFLRDDEDEALHDHPYYNMSWVLETGYMEVMNKGVHSRPPGTLIARRGSTPHRIILRRTLALNGPGTPMSAISLFLCGPRYREWGFHCPKGWRPWFEFIDRQNYSSRSERGKGCS